MELIELIESLYKDITNTLIEKELTITTMESATSGTIASLLTDTPGSSATLKGALITYSNEAKIKYGVPESTIADYGVYSRETAQAMAHAAQQAFDSDVAVGITGTFGNVDPYNPDSIPGKVFFAVRYGQKTEVFEEFIQAGRRHDFKLRTALLIGEQLQRVLKIIEE